MDFALHTTDTAPDAAKPLVQKSLDTYGFVPNLHAVMAEAPPLLEAYQLVGGLYAKTNLSVLERQVVLQAINFENGCHYCVAAHSMIATLEKMPADVLDALRAGTPIADAKLEALRSFAAKVARQRGWLDEADFDALLAAGYTRQTALEVILANAYKVMSNYVNHVAETPLDAAFQQHAWTKPAQQAAE